MSQAAKEVEEDFPRLRAIHDDLPLKLLGVIEGWSKADQLSMLNAQIKSHMNPRPGDPNAPLFHLTERESWAFEQLDYIVAMPPVMKEIAARRARGDFCLPKGVLKRAAKAKLGALLGRTSRDAGGEVRYVTHIAGVTVYTDVDFGSRSCQMRYEQNILPGTYDEKIGLASKLFLLRAVSIMDLAGAGLTRWSFLTPEAIPGAADLLGRVCIEFIEAVPRILEEAARPVS